MMIVNLLLIFGALAILVGFQVGSLGAIAAGGMALVAALVGAVIALIAPPI